MMMTVHTGEEEEEEEEEQEEEEGEEEPQLETVMIQHSGAVNRLRVCGVMIIYIHV